MGEGGRKTATQRWKWKKKKNGAEDPRSYCRDGSKGIKKKTRGGTSERLKAFRMPGGLKQEINMWNTSVGQQFKVYQAKHFSMDQKDVFKLCTPASSRLSLTHRNQQASETHWSRESTTRTNQIELSSTMAKQSILEVVETSPGENNHSSVSKVAHLQLPS